MSSRFQTLTIKQLPVPGMALVEEYFFGLHDIEWAPLILDMFSGKMDCLRILNHYGWFLSSSCAELLIEVTIKIMFPEFYKELKKYTKKKSMNWKNTRKNLNSKYFKFESLPTLGKHVRFESSYKRGSNEECYMANDCSVQGNFVELHNN